MYSCVLPYSARVSAQSFSHFSSSSLFRAAASCLRLRHSLRAWSNDNDFPTEAFAITSRPSLSSSLLKWFGQSNSRDYRRWGEAEGATAKIARVRAISWGQRREINQSELRQAPNGKMNRLTNIAVEHAGMEKSKRAELCFEGYTGAYRGLAWILIRPWRYPSR